MNRNTIIAGQLPKCTITGFTLIHIIASEAIISTRGTIKIGIIKVLSVCTFVIAVKISIVQIEKRTVAIIE